MVICSTEYSCTRPAHSHTAKVSTRGLSSYTCLFFCNRCRKDDLMGNLYDRIRWTRGVVDFIGPVDLGFMLWPIFNVADMAISCGAFLLAISFWKEENELAQTLPNHEGTGSTQ
ncbi:MAG TPA: signal peptidase II [Gemmatimonadetes bacterium]|nr:signal peptidase II [Gemmatimonadota bacterium]